MHIDRLHELSKSSAWIAWTLVLVAAITTGVCSLQAARASASEAVDVRAQIRTVSDQAPLRLSATLQPNDFTVALGLAQAPTRFISALERATHDAGVAIIGVVVADRAATTDELGRLEFALTLRGSYEGSKQVLRELSARFAGMTIRTLRMRRDSVTTAIETTAVVSIWSAPIGAAISAGR